MEALPEASAPLASTSGHFGAKANRKGWQIEDQARAPRQAELFGRVVAAAVAVGTALWELQAGPVWAQAGSPESTAKPSARPWCRAGGRQVLFVF